MKKKIFNFFPGVFEISKPALVGSIILQKLKYVPIYAYHNFVKEILRMKEVLVQYCVHPFRCKNAVNCIKNRYTRTAFILHIFLTKLFYAYMGTYLSFRRIMEPSSAGLETSNAPGKKLKIFFFIFLQLHFGIFISLGYK